jgi:hypothetical protein
MHFFSEQGKWNNQNNSGKIANIFSVLEMSGKKYFITLVFIPESETTLTRLNQAIS